MDISATTECIVSEICPDADVRSRRCSHFQIVKVWQKCFTHRWQNTWIIREGVQKKRGKSMVLRAQRRIPGKFWSLLANFMFQLCFNCSTQSRLTGWDSFHLMISVVSVSGSGIGYHWHLALGTFIQKTCLVILQSSMKLVLESIYLWVAGAMVHGSKVTRLLSDWSNPNTAYCTMCTFSKQLLQQDRRTYLS